MSLKMAALCLDARFESLQPLAARSVYRGIYAAAFTRDLLWHSRLL